METTGLIMLAGYLVFFLGITAIAQTKPQIQVMPTPKSMEDFEHQNKGCPENSECDKVMGHQLQEWRNLLSKLSDEKIPAQKKSQFLELFRNKYGVPVEFYTTQKSQQGFRPLLYNSACKEHNPKSGEKILRGEAFIKGLNKERALVWRDDAQIEVPVGSLVVPQPVTVYFALSPVTYYVPLNDQPLFVRNKELYLLREEEDLFYVLRVSPTGEWKIDSLDYTKLSQWEEKRNNVPCPVEKEKLDDKYFKVEFCKTIWDEDEKKLIIVKLREGCPS